MKRKQIYFGEKQFSNLLDAIRNFSGMRNYILSESKKGSEYMFTICDRKPESGMFMNIMDIFVGNYLIPERSMLTVKIIQRDDKIDVTVRCDVVMSGWNIINNRPNIRDTIRCERLLGSFLDHLNELKVQNI
ncbi:unnamed protein product [marine sediment metagenome]|uniref:Uncharacterized protein n=1 Tax=marine sediment metagenome TaxID=412755 RepID=X0U6I8_9ZZZZ